MCPLVLIGDKDVHSWPLFSLSHVTMTVLVYSKDYSLIFFYKVLRWLLVVVKRA